jgi:hypothetical protein
MGKREVGRTLFLGKDKSGFTRKIISPVTLKFVLLAKVKKVKLSEFIGITHVS